jgi:hypothetical protein
MIRVLVLAAVALLALPAAASQGNPRLRAQPATIDVEIRPATAHAIRAIPNPPIPVAQERPIAVIAEQPLLAIDDGAVPPPHVALLGETIGTPVIRPATPASRVGGMRQSIRSRRPAR